MQAFEFHTTAHNGFTKIPDEIIQKIPSCVKVIILAAEKKQSGKRDFFSDFGIDTTGFVFNREEANGR